MLLKGMQEVQHAADAFKALEMVLIRIAHAADLPNPSDLIKKIQESGALNAPSSIPAPHGGGGGSMMRTHGNAALSLASSQPVAQPVPQLVAQANATMPETFRELVKLFEEKREPVLTAHLKRDVYLVNFQAGLLEIRVKEYTPPNLAARVMERLNEWTGRRWMVSLSHETGAPSLEEQDAQEKLARALAAETHPLVQAVMHHFPDAKLVDVRTKPVQTENLPAEKEDATIEALEFEE
jgi:DNA polymerase-3 subunit gamma/tau